MSAPVVSRRRLARLAAVKAVYREELMGEMPGTAIEGVVEHDELEDAPYARALVEAYAENADAIDDAVSDACKGWATERLVALDRAIMRVALAEIVMRPSDYRLAISEAVELARAYSTEGSPAFVNGVLDAARRRLP